MVRSTLLHQGGASCKSRPYVDIWSFQFCCGPFSRSRALQNKPENVYDRNPLLFQNIQPSWPNSKKRPRSVDNLWLFRGNFSGPGNLNDDPLKCQGHLWEYLSSHLRSFRSLFTWCEALSFTWGVLVAKSGLTSKVEVLNFVWSRSRDPEHFRINWSTLLLEISQTSRIYSSRCPIIK